MSSSGQSYSSSTSSDMTPLLGNSNSGNNEAAGNFYFLNTRANSQASRGSRVGVTSEVEKIPYGATEEEFSSRPVVDGKRSHVTPVHNGFFAKLFGRGGFEPSIGSSLGDLMKRRQAAIKIEPKVFFANERTFLAWLHSSVLLAGASIAITSISKDGFLQLLYGVVLLPVAIAFICYSMNQYGKRAQMIRRRSPGPYEDLVGPAVLSVALILSIVAQFVIKLYSILHE